MKSKAKLKSIAYLVESTELCGGVKVIFQHAQLLHQLGFQVTVLGNDFPPDWIEYEFEYVNISKDISDLNNFDLVIATFWSTVELAERLDIGPIVHFCQGFEADYPHLSNSRKAILRSYRKPYPSLVISPHLALFLTTQFQKRCEMVSPPIDHLFRADAKKKTPTQPARILLHGIYECSWKGVSCGLETIKELRRQDIECELIRTSLIDISQQEKDILRADRYLVNQTPQTVADVTRKCDLLLFPSQREEGFGLPVLEALASGVPVVAADIPSLSWLKEAGVSLIESENPSDYARQAKLVLNNDITWHVAKRLGEKLIRKYQPETVAIELARALQRIWLQIKA